MNEMHHILQYLVIWILFGFINYWIKFTNYKEDWKKDDNQIFFIAIFLFAVILGPVGLLLTLINSKGKPFIKK